jgi:hypothetical protein
MFKRKQLLLCLSAGLFTVPTISKDLRNLTSIGMLYFLGMYFILFNFPGISIFLNSKPHYIGDLDNRKYREYCIALQNVFLSILFGVVTDIFYFHRLYTHSVIEIFAIVGGNIALITKIHYFCSKLLLVILSYCNERERKSSMDLTHLPDINTV